MLVFVSVPVLFVYVCVSFRMCASVSVSVSACVYNVCVGVSAIVCVHMFVLV